MLWKARPPLYFALALPGYGNESSLMPPVIASVFYTIVAIVGTRTDQNPSTSFHKPAPSMYGRHRRLLRLAAHRQGVGVG